MRKMVFFFLVFSRMNTFRKRTFFVFVNTVLLDGKILKA